MTVFRGPKPEYEDHAAGTIRLEIDIELWSNSGRDKHTDITEQGGWLVEVIAQALRKFHEDHAADDTQTHDIRYFGQVEPQTEGAIITRSV